MACASVVTANRRPPKHYVHYEPQENRPQTCGRKRNLQPYPCNRAPGRKKSLQAKLWSSPRHPEPLLRKARFFNYIGTPGAQEAKENSEQEAAKLKQALKEAYASVMVCKGLTAGILKLLIVVDLFWM